MDVSAGPRAWRTWAFATAGLLVFAEATLQIACGSNAQSGFSFDAGRDTGSLEASIEASRDAKTTPGSEGGVQLGVDGGGGGGSGTGNCTTLTRGCSANCTDFPSSPIMDGTPDGGIPTPSNAASYFAAADGTGAAPCLVEPQSGVLYPQNWVRPRFRVIPAPGQNLFQITLSSPRQASSLVVYTTNPTWTMPKTIWDGLRGDSWGDSVSVTVRGVNTSSGAPTSTTGSFTIAAASAGGAMIYWATVGNQNGLSWLEGFAPGDESVATTLDVGQVQARLYRDQSGSNADGGGAAQCIGCHAAAPDGNSVTFDDYWPWPGSTASVNPTSTGAVPSWLTPAGAFALSMPWLGIATFSKTDWLTEKVAVTSFGCPPPTLGDASTYPWSGQACSNQPNSSLVWIDLAASGAGAGADASADGSGPVLGGEIVAAEGQSFGFFERTGDTNGVEFPNWSHDGTTIVYVSTNAGKDGRLGSGSADLYAVPFNNRMGGTATPIEGASNPEADEYYPSHSEDDVFLAFDRATHYGDNGMYYNPYSEVYVVPSKGASSPTRLAANDPPACTSATSPGVTNSWPKWSPDVESCPDGKTYYWLVFSSTREGLLFADTPQNFSSPPDGPTSQLYITALTVDASGQIATYPALYIWNQATSSAAHGGDPQSNHTPVWEVVNIPLPPTPK